MNKNISKVASAVAAVAVLVGGFGATAQAVPGTVTTQANGSYGPLNVWFNDTYASNAATVYNWTDNVIASASKSSQTAALSCPGSSDGAALFLSDRGSESSVSNWKAFAAASFSAGSVSQANLKPSGLTSGTPGAGAVKAAGGNYSLGVACTSNSGVTVDRVFYRHIAVTASTGAFTFAATDYVYPAPTMTVTQADANKNQSPAFAIPHTGDTINATAGANIPDGFEVGYSWFANGSAISNASSSSYTTVANDAGKSITVKATYTRSGYTDVVVPAASSYTIEGDAVVSGNVAVSAGVADATNGQLALSIPNNASATMGQPSLVNNFSVTNGTLGNITVNDGRVVTRDGWDLKATVADFANQSNNAIKIAASQLTVTPNIVSSPSAGNVQAGTSGAIVNSSTPFTLASQAAFGGATDGNTVQETVGTTVINATLSLKAPQWKPAGTYTSTITITVTSK
jgi:hypothetical protein